MAGSDTLIYPREKYFKRIRQVIFGGDNGESNCSWDDTQMIFQSNNVDWGMECDQMFLMQVADTFRDKKPSLVSTGFGRTTFTYFLPDNTHYVCGSTYLADKECPEVTLRRNGNYVWPVY